MKCKYIYSTFFFSLPLKALFKFVNDTYLPPLRADLTQGHNWCEEQHLYLRIIAEIVT